MIPDRAGERGAPYEPTDAEARAFANAFGYSVAESRAFLARNGPDSRYHGTPSDSSGGAS